MFLTNMIIELIFCTNQAMGGINVIEFSAMQLKIPGPRFLTIVGSTRTTAFQKTFKLVVSFAVGPSAGV